MTSTKHTPGPWESGKAYNTSGGDLWYSVVHSPAKAGTYHTPRAAEALGVSEEEALANARLIAAAPDLLDALVECLPDLKHYVATHGPGPDKRLDAVLAAIAKATGSTEVSQ